MEHLTKQQIILLALLVSFVTSIATGIVTVALVDQAPPGVTQTINRVVERTIEKVVQSPSQTAAAATVTKETVVVRSDDLVVSAVEKNKKAVLRLYTVRGEGEFATATFESLAVVVSKDGYIASPIPAGALVADAALLPQVYKGVLYDGREIRLDLVGKDAGIALFKPILKPSETLSLEGAVLGDSSMLKLGQSVVALGGENTFSIQSGIIASLLEKTVEEKVGGEGSQETRKVTVRYGIETDMRGTPATGTVLVTLQGDVVGVYGTERGVETFVPLKTHVERLLNSLSSASASASAVAQ